MKDFALHSEFPDTRDQKTAPSDTVKLVNLAHSYVESLGKSLTEALEEYDDACIDFAGDLLDSLGYGRLAYFDTLLSPKWRYHAAVEIDGQIHDLWGDRPMSLKDYMEAIGASEVDYPLESRLAC